MKTQCKIALMLAVGLLFASQAVFADIDMDVIYTIEFPDSISIRTVTSVGDFNSDSYPDFVVSLDIRIVYLFYGGPDFDTQPDLIFNEDVYSFGENTCHLGDFNGDNIDDFVVGTPSYNYSLGRNYIYFGSTQPDTVADIIIDGYRYYDSFGTMIAGGDFNGDDYQDLISVADNYPLGYRVYIYFGSDQPDSLPDMIYYYEHRSISWNSLYAGSDLNGDGYDDYGWSFFDEDEDKYISNFFLGDESLPQNPDFTTESSRFVFLHSDISGDNIDDFMKSYNGKHLCLGGELLDIDPDYYMWYNGNNAYIYNLPGLGSMILKPGSGNIHTFTFYNAGVPFDTIPYAIIDFENEEIRPTSGRGLLTEDVNDDGGEEIIVPCYEVDIGTHYLNIYSCLATDIEEPDQTVNLPDNHQMLSCYPNPFNSSTVISYSNIAENDINIYDITGRLVKTFNCEGLSNGKVTWYAIDDNGHPVTSGIYFARVMKSEHEFSTKLIYLK